MDEIEAQFDVLIVGGGTAGWLSALIFSSVLVRTDGHQTRVGLIESPTIGTIGVGESTLPTLPGTLAGLGLVESEWMGEIGATFKLGVRFRDWCQPGSTTCSADFWNPVEQLRDPALTAAWFARREAVSFTDACCVTPPVIEDARAPRALDGCLLNEYAYHVDAVKLAGVLRREAERRGVVLMQDLVQEVVLARAEQIQALITERHGAVSARLFVDCTGFTSLLLGKAFGEPFVSYGDYLLTDRAVAIQVPYERPVERIACHTTAAALTSGWAWNVPLTSRDGTGYVYSTTFCDPDQAENELRRRLGPRSDNCEARHLRMRVGCMRRSWVGNCIAVGLASGFVEPLEATGIWLIEKAMIAFLGSLDSGGPNRFNEAMRASYEEVRDLIVMHYHVNDREDTPFWKATKCDVSMPYSLENRLREWRVRPPVRSDFPLEAVFGVTTWTAVLAGMGFWRHEPILADYDVDNMVFEGVGRIRDALLAEAPDQRVALDALTFGPRR